MSKPPKPVFKPVFTKAEVDALRRARFILKRVSTLERGPLNQTDRTEANAILPAFDSALRKAETIPDVLQ